MVVLNGDNERYQDGDYIVSHVRPGVAESMPYSAAHNIILAWVLIFA